MIPGPWKTKWSKNGQKMVSGPSEVNGLKMVKKRSNHPPSILSMIQVIRFSRLLAKLWYCDAWQPPVRKKLLFGPGNAAASAFFSEKYVFSVGTLPQAPFFSEKLRFWCWNVAAGAFFLWKIAFLVLERCRRRLFLVKKHVFGPGTLPQAPFLDARQPPRPIMLVITIGFGFGFSQSLIG